TISIKIKDSDFRQVTRSVTIREATQSSDDIIREASRLLEQYRISKKIRLVGVGASHLVSSAEPLQMDIFEQSDTRSAHRRELDEAIDTITDRFGTGAIGRASLKERK
ncbi:MAG: hypothetical protein Q7J01_07275, partial [Syntrophales bacterium]|nr:hypothetical protein [Syntrophales bacterium]